jgi:Icc-related predicted phosphoesterase
MARDSNSGGERATPGRNAEGGKKLRVAALADLHVHRATNGVYRHVFAEVSDKADVMCLCGDLTNLGTPEEAEHLAHDLTALRIPAVAVLGNHDHHSGRAEEVKRILERANVTMLEDETLEIGSVGFVGVKGFGGGFSSHMLSAFGEEATKHFVAEAVRESLALENALQTLRTPRAVVVLHYSPVIETVKGEPAEIMPFLGCSRLAETIDRFNVAVVFHGHAHHGQPRGQTQKGTPVFNCSVEVLKNTGGPGYVLMEV